MFCISTFTVLEEETELEDSNVHNRFNSLSDKMLTTNLLLRKLLLLYKMDEHTSVRLLDSFLLQQTQLSTKLLVQGWY